MLLKEREEIIIDCQKINYKVRGISAIKISVNNAGDISDYYALMPSNRSYVNEDQFIEGVLKPIFEKHSTIKKKAVINFSPEFPIFEALKYKDQEIEGINDDIVKDIFSKTREILEHNNIVLGEQYPLRNDRDFVVNNEFSSFKRKENEIMPDKINEILFIENYSKKYANPGRFNTINIVKKINSDLDQNYIIDYVSSSGKFNYRKLHQFKSEIEKDEFFKGFFEELSVSPNKSFINNNDYTLLKYKNNNVIMKKMEGNENNYEKLLSDDKIVNYLKDCNDIFSLEVNKVKEKIELDEKSNRLNFRNILAGNRNKQLSDRFAKNYKNGKEISHVLLKRLESEDNENIFVLVVEQEKIDGVLTKNIKKFSLDLNSGNNDLEVFEKFKNIFESKMGYPIESVRSNNAQISLDNFSEKKAFSWAIRQELKSNVINMGFESGTAYSRVLNEYIKSNIDNMEIKNRLLAADGPTEAGVICVYSDASVRNHVKDAISYGISIRKPESDDILREIRGVKYFRDHSGDTNAAEEIGIIEALKGIKLLMEMGQLPKDHSLEFRVDNIDAVQVFEGKDGVDNKVEEMYSSQVFTKKEVNDLLAFFKPIRFKWIKGHCNNIYNERADRVACSAWDLHNNEFKRKGFLAHNNEFSGENEKFDLRTKKEKEEILLNVQNEENIVHEHSKDKNKSKNDNKEERKDRRGKRNARNNNCKI